MNSNSFYQQILKTGVAVKKAAEIGVYSFETSQLRALIEWGVCADLYEAVPEYYRKILESVQHSPHVHLRNIAVSDTNGRMTFCLAGPSTFNATQDFSPAINHDGYLKRTANTIEVPSADFADLDPGDYDLVCIDVEGGEYQILKRMKSRPSIIVLETQSRDYINPYLGSITDWMVRNKYFVWLWNDTDTIFSKGSRFPSGGIDRLKAIWHNYRFYGGRL